MLLFLVSFSAGALMGGAFIHLLPEASENFADGDVYSYVLFSFVLFFLIEKLLHWRHCHQGKCDVHTFGYINIESLLELLKAIKETFSFKWLSE
ncbi:MAG: ZIP family metal transporter [Microgenomates group bacterium]